MKFKTWLETVHSEDPHCVFCPCGESEVQKKHLVVGKDGYPVLENCGKHDLYAEIQSYRDSCDLASILQTFDLGSIGGLTFDELGDLNDFTNVPKSPAEMLRSINEGELLFSQLPVGVRSSFNHSLYNFVSSFGSPDFYDRLSAAYGVQQTVDSGSSGDGSGIVDPDSGSVSPIEPSVPISGTPTVSPDVSNNPMKGVVE